MPYPFQTTGFFTGSISSGSYFNESDNDLFYRQPTRDFWFGFSPFDFTEVSVYDFEDNQLAWDIVDNDVGFKTLTFSYENEKNEVVSYSYNQFVNSFILYKNDKILDHITEHLSKLGIGNGEYKMVYNYVRFLAGDPNNQLSIKDISPSRKELKVIPTTENTVRFQAFCNKQFQIKDISSLLIQLTNNCPYDEIYRKVKNQYQESISFLQTIFFLPTDGDVLRFLKNLYEDYVKYVPISEENIASGLSPDRVKRIQGIRTYYQNWMRSNNDTISDFDVIENKFVEYTNYRIDEQFEPYKVQKGKDYLSAKNFLHDFFIKYFYKETIDPLEESYVNKYSSYLKNALDFGNNRYVLILNTSTTIEDGQRILLIKLSEELPSDIKIKDRCWVSNVGMVPYVFQVSIKGTVSNKTFKISPPNFLVRTDDVSTKNINRLYTAEDLRQDDYHTDDINIQKKITELNVDYSSFSNFVVFSSAYNRITVFKNKVIEWTVLSSSLSTLQTYSSSAYPYHAEEISDIKNQMSDIVNSFDGYEAYLFNTKNFSYNSVTETWVSSSYVSSIGIEAEEYDKNNADSLINNTPEYISIEGNSEEYLTFLTMIGHYFDNLYLYIKSMPSERAARNQTTGSMSVNMLRDMLASFGWNVDDILGDKSPDTVYLNSETGGSNSMSDSERMRYIWNRLLVTLPQLYKTKGTEECVRLILACHGIPTDLISVKEYGGIDYSSIAPISYIQNEKVFMMRMTTSNPYWEIPFPHLTKTVEFKFAAEDYRQYHYGDDIPLAWYLPSPFTTGPGQWRIGIRKGKGNFEGHVYFRIHETGSYDLTNGPQTPYRELTSSTLPIFNGDIFSVMLRRNYPNSLFTTSSVTSSIYFETFIPAQYDLYVQRNESGRVIFKSTTSTVLTESYNRGFSDTSKLSGNKLIFGNWTGSSLGNKFVGLLDKIRIWRVPIDDIDFEDHVNDLNSYSWYSSSAENLLQKNLYFLSDVTYPVDVSEPMYVTGSRSGSFGVCYFPNANEYYTAPISWVLSGSYTSSIYTSESQISWIPYNDLDFRSGSVVYFFNAIWQNVSHSLSSNGCYYLTHSVYPYQYEPININQTYTIGKYGPNKFKNSKIKKFSLSLDVRLDDLYSSTTPIETLVSSDSNIFGFFSDPQDFKNKDIVRYFGKNGVLDEISNPESLYSSSYTGLANQRNQYVNRVNKRTLFTELMTLNKFYFDKSIFNTIKAVAPARANTLTGILIEPSIIERPKYQHKKISSSLDSGGDGKINDIYNSSCNLLWTEFSRDSSDQSFQRVYEQYQYDYIDAKNKDSNLDEPPWYQTLKAAGEIIYYKGFEYMLDDYQRIRYEESLPPNYTAPISLSYISNPNSIYPENYGDWESSCYYNDLLDEYQLGWFTDRDGAQRHDSVISNGINPKGATSQKCAQFCPSSSAIYYLMKRWRKYNIHSKTGEYVHDNNPRNNLYNTASVYLYDIIHVTEDFYKSIVYINSLDVRELLDPIPTLNYVGGIYKHLPNTFISSSNDYRSNVKSFTSSIVDPTILSFYEDYSDFGYFELFSGYPRNHYIHKMQLMSPSRFSIYSPTPTTSCFTKGRQTIDTTIGTGSLCDNSLPVTSIDVSNVNVVAGDNILN